jgi:hypothetical protein
VETEFVLRMQFSQAIHELAPEHLYPAGQPIW